MKAIELITHPVTLIICFSLVLISGEHFGGFYLLYILLGLPHGATHSLLAVGGIAILLFSNYKYKRAFAFLIEPFLNIIGVVLLGLSLVLFFYKDNSHYNDSTFNQMVPMITITVFVLLIISFVVNNVIKMKGVAT